MTSSEKLKRSNKSESPKKAPSLVSLIVDVRDSLRQTIAATDREQGIRKITLSLETCKSAPEAFAKCRDGVNDFLDLKRLSALVASKHPGNKRHKESLASIATAVEGNDFDVLPFARNGEEYGLALEIAAEKNKLIAEVVRGYFGQLREKPSEFDLEEAEKKVVTSFLDMIGDMDQLYIKWRSGIYPKGLLEKMKGKDAEDAAGILEENGLDDPYAVVNERGDGEFVSVPYSLAFPEEHRAISEKISKLIDELQSGGDGSKEIDRENTVAYLRAYQKALNCQESRKEGDEWVSVSLWKEVDRCWLKCEDRVQFIHGIETGYEASVDPAEIKVIPELKILMRNDITPNTRKLMEEMRVGNARTLTNLLHDKPEALQSLRSYDRSHVGSYTVISGGGNSMDGLGVAQVGPNYDDVSREYGLKSYVSKEDLFSSEELRDAISAQVFGAEVNERDLGFLGDDESRDHYMVQSVASHELGHMLLGNSSIPKIEEAKATWTGLVAMDEREKRGELPAGTSAKMMMGQVKYCLKYLGGEEGEVSDYLNEGIMNMKIFLEVGLITNDNGHWRFDPTKVSSAYARMREVWLELTDSYLRAEREGEGSMAQKAHDKAVSKWVRWTPEIKKLRERVLKGIEEYNRRHR